MSSLKNIAKFNVAIAELIDVPNPTDSSHPFAKIAKFIFADDEPNGNKQGIRVTEFPNIINSSVGMPIKMNFTGYGVSDHGGSIPIGHIRSMEATSDGVANQLVTEAMLWKEEFPEEIEYLEKAFASGEAPGLSYEIDYKASDFDEDGTQWIKGTTTLAATFVDRPAYGSRTRLLALASLDEEERNAEIVALAEHIKSEQETDEGGNPMEEELEKLRADLATANQRVTDLEGELATASTDRDNVTSERDTVTAELATLKTTAMIESRVRQYIEAGFKLEEDQEKADARKSVFASYDDAQWAVYLDDLKAASVKIEEKEKEGAAAFASLLRPSNDVPRIELDEDKTSLKDAMHMLARPYSI